MCDACGPAAALLSSIHAFIEAYANDNQAFCYAWGCREPDPAQLTMDDGGSKLLM